MRGAATRMAPFRGSDEVLDHEVETLETIARQRLRRYARELEALDRDLRELKREQAARRRARAVAPVSTTAESASDALAG